MQRKEIHNKYYNALCEIYPNEEARSSAYILMEDLHNISKTDLIINPTKILEVDNIKDILHQISQHTPIQYITNKAYFMGLEIYVENGVLIPRPETEELVEKICRESSNAKEVLEIGTGSGIIAITIAKGIKECNVTTYDISPKAIKIAKLNADRHNCKNITFEKQDILAIDMLDKEYDIIVSNPPYICHKEKPLMRCNVLNHEPEIALFVPDNDPLIFYRKIAQLAVKALTKGGALYFEINENYSQEMKEMLEEIGFNSIEIVIDLYNKPRIIKAIL